MCSGERVVQRAGKGGGCRYRRSDTLPGGSYYGGKGVGKVST